MPQQPVIVSAIRYVILTAIFGTLLLGGGVKIFQMLLALRKPPDRVATAKPATTVRTVIAKKQDFQEKILAYGIVRPLQATNVEAEVPGIVKWISPKLEAGQTVQAGEELVKLDDRDFVRAVANADAALAQANITVEILKLDIVQLQKQLPIVREELAAANRELSRLQNLERAKQVSTSVVDAQFIQASLRERGLLELEWQLQSRNLGIERANSDVTIRTAQLAQAKTDLSRTVIVAPYAGRIDSRQVQLGLRINLTPGKPLFYLIDTVHVEAAIAIGASHFGRIAATANVILRRREDGDVIWQGKISRIAPSVNSAERTFLVFLDIHNGAGNAIPPGTFVFAEIEGQLHRDVITLPRIAFLGEKIFIASLADPSRKATPIQECVVQERLPQILKFLPDTVLLQGGLEPGEAVIISGIEEIGPGSRVIAIPEGQAFLNVSEGKPLANPHLSPAGKPGENQR